MRQKVKTIGQVRDFVVKMGKERAEGGGPDFQSIQRIAMTSQHLRQIAMRQLESRCGRLMKLIKLGAPGVIICNEVRLLQKPIALMEDEFVEMHRRDGEQKVAEAKNSVGLCCVQGCLNEYVTYEDDEWDEGSLMCEKHRDGEELLEKIFPDPAQD